MSTPSGRFADERVAQYDDTVRKAIPGYDLLHDVTASLLDAALGPEARILVVGAGTGTDILRLARVRSGWRFVGVDPADPMLRIAKGRLAGAGLAGRVDLVGGTVDAVAAAPPFDAAVCLLVSHFLPDDGGAKGDLYGAVADRLAPGAPFLLADFSPMPDQEAALMETAWVAWQRHGGIHQDAIERGLAYARRSTFPIDPDRLRALLAAAGCSAPLPVAQALHTRAWLSRRLDPTDFLTSSES